MNPKRCNKRYDDTDKRLFMQNANARSEGCAKVRDAYVHREHRLTEPLKTLCQCSRPQLRVEVRRKFVCL